LEFNLLYRWHAAISDRDDKWTQGFAKKVFPGKDMSKISTTEFVMGLGAWKQTLNADPGKRDFDLGNIKRDPKTGTFDDATLIKVLTESIEDTAGNPHHLLLTLLFLVCVLLRRADLGSGI
jgi:linoleate 8R-lipoxygenase / 9,12-octadecadienoate 8-hydroperoxide 8R-isomerase